MMIKNQVIFDMLWALLSILSGLGDAISFSAIKRLRSLNSTLLLTFINLSVLLPVSLGLLFYGFSPVPYYFYILVFITSVLFMIGQYFIIESLKSADLSKTVPMLSFTPVFTLLTSYIVLKEIPSALGLVGVMLIVIGAYIVNFSKYKTKEIRFIFKDKASMQMLLVAFLFSITSVLAKKGIILSNPAHFMFVHYLINSIILVMLFYKKIKSGFGIFKKSISDLSIYGIAAGISELLIAIAITSSIVPYVISLKRTSIIFSVIIGYFFFKEKDFKFSLMGSLIMFVGVLLITLF